MPESPNLSCSQNELLDCAKTAFGYFGIDVDIDRNQLSMKKYKNCVVFSLGKYPQTILWHYSGKFYYGGWKNNDPG